MIWTATGMSEYLRSIYAGGSHERTANQAVPTFA